MMYVHPSALEALWGGFGFPYLVGYQIGQEHGAAPEKLFLTSSSNDSDAASWQITQSSLRGSSALSQAFRNAAPSFPSSRSLLRWHLVSQTIPFHPSQHGKPPPFDLPFLSALFTSLHLTLTGVNSAGTDSQGLAGQLLSKATRLKN